jgi:hypothetical protein
MAIPVDKINKLRKRRGIGYSRTKYPMDYGLTGLGIQTNNSYQRSFVEESHSRTGEAVLGEDFILNLIGKEGIGTVSVEDVYGSVVKVTVISTEEEIRRTVKMYKKAVVFFGSFAAVGVASCSVFITLGFVGNISTLHAIIGSVITAGITFGVFKDFRRWDRNHA